MLGLLGVVLAGLFVSGCSTLPPAWRPHPITNTSSLKNKNTIVVPVQGAAVSMQNSQIGTAALFGIVGVAIKESLVDKPQRDALLAKTGEHASVFSPEVVLAEECVNLLNRSTWSSGTNVTLYSGLEKMHGLAPEIEGEQRPFKTTFSDFSAWKKAYDEWLIGSPIHTFSTNEAGSGQLVSLEVTIVYPLLKGKTLAFGVLIRLMDPVSGRSITSSFCRDEFSVHPIKSAADVDAFVADYRKCARQLSETVLKQMNLIP